MEKLCSQMTERALKELQKKEVKQTIECEILDPMVSYIGHRLFPYVILVSVMMCITLLAVLYLLRLCYRLQGHK